jgi:hypothetical protein
MQTLDRFAAVINAGTERLVEISDEDSLTRPAEGGWSKREELGHLIDSAINNYARVIRIQQENDPALPGYQQDAWVERQGYQERDWRELIALWAELNHHMLNAARRVPPAARSRQCTIGGSASMTLGFVIEDYVDHMVHHLQHVGISLSEFRRPESAYA